MGLSGTEVSEAQMRADFGDGAHPNRDAMLASRVSDAATRLGSPFRHFQDLAPLAERVAERSSSFEAETGRAPTAAEYKRIAAEEGRRVRRAGPGTTWC